MLSAPGQGEVAGTEITHAGNIMAMLLICPLIQKTFFLIIAGFTIRILASTGLLQLPGHLQALGLHQDPGGKIKEVHGFLEPGEFFDEFVKKSTAVLFKRSCVEFKAFEMWTDEFLRFVYFHLNHSNLLITQH